MIQPTGVIDTRAAGEPRNLQPNSLIQLDFDKVDPERYDDLFKAVCEDPHVVLAFRSPSGGIKALGSCEESDDALVLTSCMREAAEWFNTMGPCEIDRSINPSHPLFLSYDPDAYLDEEPWQAFTGDADWIESERSKATVFHESDENKRLPVPVVLEALHKIRGIAENNQDPFDDGLIHTEEATRMTWACCEALGQEAASGIMLEVLGDIVTRPYEVTRAATRYNPEKAGWGLMSHYGGTEGRERLEKSDAQDYLADDGEVETSKKDEEDKNKWRHDKINTFSDLLTKKPKLRPELIFGLLREKELMTLSGGSKTNKSWSLIDLSIHCALGLEWWGAFKPVRKLRTLFVDFELGKDTFYSRGMKVLGDNDLIGNFNSSDLDNLVHMNLEKSDLTQDKIIKEIQGQLNESRFDIVIIDPVYLLINRDEKSDENSNSDVTRALMALRKTVKGTKTSIIAALHHSKGTQKGKSHMDMAAGAGAFARNADNVCSLRPHDQEDPEDPEAFTFQASLRRFAPMKPFCLRREDALLVPAPDLQPDTGQANRPEPANPELTLLAYFEEETTEEWVRAKDWKDWAAVELDMGGSAFDRAKLSLIRTGRIESNGKDGTNGVRWRAVQNASDVEDFDEQLRDAGDPESAVEKLRRLTPLIDEVPTPETIGRLGTLVNTICDQFMDDHMRYYPGTDFRMKKQIDASQQLKRSGELQDMRVDGVYYYYRLNPSR
jgi:hypothetical protein